MSNDLPAHMRPERSFQGLILALQRYWADYGCVILQPYDMEVGAGTFHPATTLRALGPRPWNAAYVQPSRRPKDGRYGENPNRLQHYYQFQVILKPSPDDIQELYLKSLVAIGIDPRLHDIRFVEDDWESPTLGAWGLGWECWCDGMEVSQFTYFQQVAGFECAPVSGELTYGLERLAMYVQGVDRVFDLNFNGREGDRKVTYGDVFLQAEKEYSRHNFEFADTAMLFEQFKMAEAACRKYVDAGWTTVGNAKRHLMALPAYDQCIKASHVFNLLDARGVISVTERQSYILRVRELAKACGEAWLATEAGGADLSMIPKSCRLFGSDHAPNSMIPKSCGLFGIRSCCEQQMLGAKSRCSSRSRLAGSSRRLRACGLLLADEHHVALDQILDLRRSGLLRRQVGDVQQCGDLQPGIARRDQQRGVLDLRVRRLRPRAGRGARRQQRLDH